jgi:uncharacterized protein (TIGR00251 family)
MVGDDVLEIAVHAQPGAGRTQVVGRHGDAVKIRVAAPPEAGRANDALAGVLAEAFGVAAKDVELVSGQASRQKRFRVAGVAPDDVEQRVEDLLVGARGRRSVGGPSGGYPAAPSRRTPRNR